MFQIPDHLTVYNEMHTHTRTTLFHLQYNHIDLYTKLSINLIILSKDGFQ